MNISKSLNQFHMQNKALQGIEQLVYKVNNIIINNSSDIKIFNAKQLQKINHLEISELFPPNMQVSVCFIYTNKKQ